jgi:hypothetical protein
MRDTAKGVRFFKNSVEHRAEIAGRGIEGLKHLCQGRLAGQRFVALRGPRLERLPRRRYRLPETDVCVVGHCLLAYPPPCQQGPARRSLTGGANAPSSYLAPPCGEGSVSAQCADTG